MVITNSDFLIYASLIAIVVFITGLLLEVSIKTLSISRLIALLVAVGSALLIYLKPFYTTLAEVDTTILLTEGSSHLDSLKNAHQGAAVLDWTDTASITSLTNHIIVDGYGIPNYDYWKFDDKEVDIVGVNAPKGIIKAYYPNNIQEGDQFEISLLINQLSGCSIKLKAYGSDADSVRIKGLVQQTISLSTVPEVAGRYVFEIEVSDSLNQKIHYPVPVEIIPEPKLKVLMLNELAGYEFKFLKNHLVEEGHEVSMRTKITKERYRYENFNNSIKTNINFSSYNLLIISTQGYNELSKSEQLKVQNAVQQDGRSLVLLSSANAAFPAWLNLRSEVIDDNSAKVRIEKDDADISITNQVFVPGPLDEAVLSSVAGVLSISKVNAKGKVTVSALTNTYKLFLQGNQKTYDDIWTTIIESALMSKSSPLSFDDYFTTSNEPKFFEVSGYLDPDITYGGKPVPLRQNPFLKDRWSGVVWPSNSGWHSFILNESDTIDFYIFDDEDWISLKQYHTSINNKIKWREPHDETNLKNSKKAQISIWWFYLFFLVGMGYLWLEPKLR